LYWLQGTGLQQGVASRPIKPTNATTMQHGRKLPATNEQRANKVTSPREIQALPGQKMTQKEINELIRQQKQRNNNRQTAIPEGTTLYSTFPAAADKKQRDSLRKYANWAALPFKMILDSPSYNAEYFKKNWRLYSSKYGGLIDAIKKTDEQDLRTYGKTFKHVIYTDLGSNYRGYGVKLIAAILLAEGFKMAKYGTRGTNKKKTYIVDVPDSRERLNFISLSSTSFKGKYFFTDPKEPFPDTAEKRTQLATAAKDKFNESPGNSYGETLRFMVIDSGYKEGIDLKDCRHIWLTEPPRSKESLNQAIGRVTRMCGSKGLKFEPGKGWELYIHVLYSVVHTRGADNIAHKQLIYKLQEEKASSKYDPVIKTKLIEMAKAASVDRLLFKNVNEGIRQGYRDPEIEIARMLGIP
jgi:hypothetical protein